MNNNRIEWVDYSKGFAILLIVLGHVLDGMNDSHVFSSYNFFYFTHKIIYGFHVPIFFFISGLFTEKWINNKNCIVSKAKSLIFPYLILSFVQGAFNVLLSSSTNHPMTWKELFIHIIYSPFGQFWFLYVLFLSFMFYFLLRKSLKFNIHYVLIIAVVLFFARHILKVWVTPDLFGNFIFFVAGSLIFSKHRKLLDYILNLHCLVLIIIFVGANTIYATCVVPKYFESFERLLIAAIGICLVINISAFLSIAKHFVFLRYVGSISLVIYLFHVFATSGCRIMLLKIFKLDNLPIHLILGVIFGITFPIVVNYVLILLKSFFDRKHSLQSPI